MSRSLAIWCVFALCLAVLLTAMGWMSWAVVRLDRAEADARRQARLEENVRLALWRIDTAVAPLLAQESVRPFFVYQPFFPANRGYGWMFNRRADGDGLVPSPLLRGAPPQVSLHFQFSPAGQLTSPEVPTGDALKLAVPKYLTEQQAAGAAARLKELERLVSRGSLVARVPKHEAPADEGTFSAGGGPEPRIAVGQRRVDPRGRGQAGIEFDLRNEVISQNANVLMQSQMAAAVNLPPSPAVTEFGGVLMTPLWIDGRLLLARRITISGQEYVQGCWIDWPAVKMSLLETIADLLPGADLRPAAAEGRQDESRMLAALPVRLIPGPTADTAQGSPSPLVLSLIVAWGCVLLAAAAAGALLAGVMRLNGRRAAFVSAVTHELRTPLTTFQMYAEMLVDGMVPDAQRQQHYLRTLRAEAVRLTHLVENVLAYARLERGRHQAPPQATAVADLIRGVCGHLAARAEQAGMMLVVEEIANGDAAMVSVNPTAVGQILFNLVDNACKYAAQADDKRIHLIAISRNGSLEIAVQDHGPGLSPVFRRRLFQPFSKSAEEAARSAPGIGLGLALSRRLARDMGGDLRFDAAAQGARFVLFLPFAT